MVRVNWKSAASEMARYVYDEMFDAHRGVIETNIAGVWAAFGNDGYPSDVRSQREVESLRKCLLSNGSQFLALAVHNDYTWVVLFKPANGMTKDDIIAVLWDAWINDHQGDIADCFRHVQANIAQNRINNVGSLAAL